MRVSRWSVVAWSLVGVCSAVAGCGGFHPASYDAGSDGGLDQGVSPFTVVSAKLAGETLTSVWGADEKNVFAVGSNGLHCEYDGTWHCSQTNVGRDLYAVWGTSASDVYYCGVILGSDTGVVAHFDGVGWRDEYIAPTALYGLWGDGSLVLAVGAQGMIYGKKAGTTVWAQRQFPALPANPAVTITADSPILWGIAGNKFGDLAMPGDADRVFHQEGMNGIINLDPTVDRSLVFHSVWATPGRPGDFFFGTNYLGVAWLTTAPPTGLTMLADQMYTVSIDQTQTGADQLFIHGIWGTAVDVLFVGDQGRIYRYDAGTNHFGPVPSPAVDALWGIWGSSPSDVWIVGQRETILHGRLP